MTIYLIYIYNYHDRFIRVGADKMQIGFKTDIGNHRSINEDAFFVSISDQFFLIADGVGGCNSGEIASNFAVNKIADYFKENSSDLHGNKQDTFKYFSQCLNYVNRYIFDYAKKNVDTNGMATTIIIVYLVDDTACIANIGDSRVYLIRDEEIFQITEDHTLVSEYVKKGTITPEEAQNHPQKNIITRALGSNQTVEADFYKIDIQENDIFILCTDGLYGELSNQEICQTALAHDDMQKVCDELVSMSIEKAGSDNITVISFKV